LRFAENLALRPLVDYLSAPKFIWKGEIMNNIRDSNTKFKITIVECILRRIRL